MYPALVLLEFSSIAVGILAGDAMAKRARLGNLALGTVHPGRFLIVAGGDVGSIEEAWQVGRDLGAAALVGEVFLADVHPSVVAALSGAQREFVGDALGVVETTTVAATLRAADRALKSTEVALGELRLADGLGGKGYALFSGGIGEVQAAVEEAVAVIAAAELVAQLVVPRLDSEVARNLTTAPRFAAHWEVDRRRSAPGRKKVSRKKTSRKTATRRTKR